VPGKRAVTEKQLRDAEKAYRDAAKLHDKARAARNDLVRTAADEGWSYEALAAVLDLSRSRVGQIAGKGAAPRRPGRRRS
jgi:ribosome-binding protein aMBF1 (putative translation factor)